MLDAKAQAFVDKVDRSAFEFDTLRDRLKVLAKAD
jgi:hypothetical protein